jgi:hypothetical protein
LPPATLVSVVTVRRLLAVPPGDRITLVGLRAKWIPPGAPGVLSCTVPWNPPMLATVTVEFLEDPARITMLVGLADTANPGTVARTWTVLRRLPLTPETVTLYVPAGVVEVAETVRSELPNPLGARAILVGLREAEGPGGEAIAERDTLPENPPRLVRPIVVVFVLPGGSIRDGREVDRVKSCIGFTCTVWEATPTVPRESMAERWIVNVPEPYE